MKLMEIISVRTFVLNYKLQNIDRFWNEIYNLLSIKSSCSPKENLFILGIKNAKIYKPKLNLNSVFVHLELTSVNRVGFLLIKFSKEVEFQKNWKIKYFYILVTNKVLSDNDYGLHEFLRLYNSVSIENILDNTKDPYLAFHTLKQFLSFSNEDYSSNDENKFDVYGIEEE